MIKGWDEGFATMKKGEKAFLTCGPTYAYGASGSPPLIPANSVLRFEVELVSFAPKPKQNWQLSEAERAAEAEAHKDAGNAAFARGDLEAAAEAYGAAWGRVSDLTSADSAALRCAVKLNSAAVALKRCDYRAAAADAGAAAAINPASAKAHFRLGSAQAALGDFAASKRALVRAAKLAPADKAIQAEYARVKALADKAKAASASAFRGLFTTRGAVLGGSGEEGAGSGGIGAPKDWTAEGDEEEEGEEEGEGEGGGAAGGGEQGEGEGGAAPAAPAAPAAAAPASGEEKLDD